MLLQLARKRIQITQARAASQSCPHIRPFYPSREVSGTLEPPNSIMFKDPSLNPGHLYFSQLYDLAFLKIPQENA